jgi:hypothetical protein
MKLTIMHSIHYTPCQQQKYSDTTWTLLSKTTDSHISTVSIEDEMSKIIIKELRKDNM